MIRREQLLYVDSRWTLGTGHSCGRGVAEAGGRATIGGAAVNGRQSAYPSDTREDEQGSRGLSQGRRGALTANKVRLCCEVMVRSAVAIYCVHRPALVPWACEGRGRVNRVTGGGPTKETPFLSA